PAASSGTDRDPRRWLVLALLCLALVVVGIDGQTVHVEVHAVLRELWRPPRSVGELGPPSSQLQWIVDAYTIVFASFLLIAGNTGDRLGRKWCFLGGLVVFGSGSLACALVDSPSALIATRAVQGFGAAFIMPATLSIL